jgi:hypothetical protein
VMATAIRAPPGSFMVIPPVIRGSQALRRGKLYALSHQHHFHPRHHACRDRGRAAGIQ